VAAAYVIFGIPLLLIFAAAMRLFARMISNASVIDLDQNE
jgi:hypothetical protein